jgi:hypothetical protein
MSTALKRMGCVSLVVLLTTLSTLIRLDLAFAQTAYVVPPAGVLKQYKRAVERTVDQIVADFGPHLRPEHRAMLKLIDIGVTSSGNFDRVFAINGRDGRQIKIDVGFVLVMELIQDAVILTYMHGVGDAKTFESYVDRVAEMFIRNSNLYREGKPMNAIPPYVEFVALPATRVQSIYNSPGFQNVRVDYKVETLAVILGHELGHHFLGHLDLDALKVRRGSTLTESEKLKESRRREAKADAFGVDLAIKAGYSPMKAAWPFIFFAVLGDDPDVTARSHPDSGCRAGRVFESGAVAARANPEFLEELRRKGLLTRWEKEVEGELKRLNQTCSDE